jgi:hypothetical protein
MAERRGSPEQGRERAGNRAEIDGKCSTPIEDPGGHTLHSIYIVI